MIDAAAVEAMMSGDFEEVRALFRAKGNDYARADDALHQFKLSAEQMGLTLPQVWGVYAGKHWAAISTFIRDGELASEPIEGRVHDLILYLFLLLAIVREAER